MPINKSTEYGNIEISLDAIANLAGVQLLNVTVL